MAALNTVALWIGWAVIVAGVLLAVCSGWWWIGSVVWERVLPSDWKRGQMVVVPGMNPRLRPAGLAVMFVLGGPWGWLRAPHMFWVQRQKLKHLRKYGEDA